MAKIRKKHSKTKRTQRATKGFLMESWESWKEGEFAQAKAWIKHPVLGKVPAGHKEWDKANIMDRNWKVRVLVRCITPNRERYIEEAEIIAQSCRLNDLSSYYLRIKEEAINAVNPKHIVDVGWTAEALT